MGVAIDGILLLEVIVFIACGRTVYRALLK